MKGLILSGLDTLEARVEGHLSDDSRIEGRVVVGAGTTIGDNSEVGMRW